MRSRRSRAWPRPRACSRPRRPRQKSTPPKPFTCRSTKPGTAIPRPRLPSATPATTPSASSRSPGTSAPSTSTASTPSLIAASRLRRTTPPFSSRRALRGRGVDSLRAARRSRPSRRRPAASSAASTSRFDAPVASSTARRARARSFALPGDDVDHQVPERLPEPHHRDGRDRVQDELLGGPGLHPGRAGDHLRADDGVHGVVGQLGERAPRARRRRRRSALPHRAQLTLRRGRRPSGRSPRVRRRRRPGRPRRRGRPPRRRSASSSTASCSATSAWHAAGLEPERRPALGGVHRREPPDVPAPT